MEAVPYGFVTSVATIMSQPDIERCSVSAMDCIWSPAWGSVTKLLKDSLRVNLTLIFDQYGLYFYSEPALDVFDLPQDRFIIFRDTWILSADRRVEYPTAVLITNEIGQILRNLIHHSPFRPYRIYAESISSNVHQQIESFICAFRAIDKVDTLGDFTFNAVLLQKCTLNFNLNLSDLRIVLPVPTAQEADILEAIKMTSCSKIVLIGFSENDQFYEAILQTFHDHKRTREIIINAEKVRFVQDHNLALGNVIAPNQGIPFPPGSAVHTFNIFNDLEKHQNLTKKFYIEWSGSRG
ncbi:hypothetical protein L596_006113 [Steinernema carpocapsae]|uniref:Uncharacterized protein n=1 Tax=Steinernema carpocapsae TaxID=34508 RepID=A0A4U8V155_STECR|nr:hypothetical protein L596_006113 [Steinernema carpocapsae]